MTRSALLAALLALALTACGQKEEAAPVEEAPVVEEAPMVEEAPAEMPAEEVPAAPAEEVPAAPAEEPAAQ